MSYIIIKSSKDLWQEWTPVLETKGELKAWLADGSLKLGDMVVEVKLWQKVVKDGQGIALEPIKVKDALK